MNHIEIRGKLGKYTKFASTPNGESVCNFAISFKDSEKESFIDCTAWREIADDLRNLREGSELEITGNLTVQSWKDKQTSEWKKKVKVNALHIKILKRLENVHDPRSNDGWKTDDMPY